MKSAQYFESITHDPLDPDPTLALYLDDSVPLDRDAKAALLGDLRSKSRQFVLPVVRPVGRAFIVINQLVKVFVPRAFTSSRLLHRLLVWGLKHWVSSEGNFLILRHFHLGSQVLAFIRSNVPGVELPLNPLLPQTLDDLADDVFLKHDLNVYNFVIRLNREMKDKGLAIKAPERIDFSAIVDAPLPLEPLPDRWSNFLDLQTAIELYTPIYQLFLTDSDFWRASNSLQLDETIAIYVARLFGDASHLGLVNNKHPLVPESTLRAGWRLMLHGLALETLHAILVHRKREQAEVDSRTLAAATAPS